MKRYCIINRTFNAPETQIICKSKRYSRFYRQNISNIDKSLIVYKTTINNAKSICEHYNKEFYKGWEIVEFEQYQREFEKEQQ